MEEKEKLEAIRVEYDRAIKAQSERDHVWGVLVLMIDGTDHSAELVDDAMLNYWSFDKFSRSCEAQRFKKEIGY